jgi:hypothetical protein
MWRPLEMVLYDWWPIRREARLYTVSPNSRCPSSCPERAEVRAAGERNPVGTQIRLPSAPTRGRLAVAVSMLRFGAMTVSASDREFMRRIGEAKAASHAEAAARHRALPLRERLRRSWAVFLAGRSMQGPAERDDDPTPFYERARALGLYRP